MLLSHNKNKKINCITVTENNRHHCQHWEHLDIPWGSLRELCKWKPDPWLDWGVQRGTKTDSWCSTAGHHDGAAGTHSSRPPGGENKK